MGGFRKYVVPGLVFQSVVIGGGYATGRELIEFFFASGPIGGVLGLVTAGAVFGLVLAAAFEFARVTGTYDYRSFCRTLLGPAWVVFEIAYLILLVLILSVIGSASGELTAASFGAPPLVGTLALMVLTGVLTFYGSETIQRVLASWSALLYAVYITLFVLAYATFADRINDAYVSASVGGNWLSDGVRYAGYNLASFVAVLFCVKRLTRRRETIGAGFIAGAITVIPGLLFYVAMMAFYPEIGGQPIPAAYLMAELNITWFKVVFQIVIFGTFVETGAGLLHAVNERLDASFQARGRAMPQYLRPVVATTLLAVSIFAASAVGIVDLIANGYGILTYVFIGVLIIPLLTIGLWKIRRASVAVSPALAQG